jgi:hypothetical protein
MQLTPRGLDLLIERIDKVEAAQREILSPLAARDRVAFMRYLRKLAGLATQSG